MIRSVPAFAGIVAAALIFAPPPSAAQDAPARVVPFVVAQATAVDETALRYFARQGDQERVDAEIARLRALYPDWEPPENLLEGEYTPDPLIERIWELYGEGDFAGARAAIAEKQSDDPAWQPTEDMLSSLQLGEAAERLRNASDARQYETVIRVAANNPDLLTCANVDLLWRLADAFIATDATDRGIDAYTYVLSNCDNAEERFATLQQASEHLEPDDLEPLLALERADGEGPGEFAPLRLDLARNAILEVLAGSARRADPDVVAELEASALEAGSGDDLRLLGWYARSQNRPEDALDWFERAMEADPSALSANGLGVTLVDLGRYEDAEDILAAYASEDEELQAVYLSAAAALLAEVPRIELEPEVLARIVEATTDARAVAVAQELGWYAYDFNQPRTAAAWFETALEWNPDDEPSAYGLLVSSDRLGDTARVSAIKAAWSARSERIAQFGTGDATLATPAATTAAGAPVPPQYPAELAEASIAKASAAASASQAPTRAAPAAQAAAATSTPAPAITVTYQGCSSYVPPASLSANQALNRGWCLLDMLRAAEAAESFGRALQSGSQSVRVDAAYGQALAYVRMGLAEDAAVAAAAAPQPRDRIIELQTAILTLTAISSYEAGDYRRALMALDERSLYAAEQNDLLTLRAWSYFHLRRFGEAEQIFEAVAATGYRDAASGLAAARGAMGR